MKITTEKPDWNGPVALDMAKSEIREKLIGQVLETVIYKPSGVLYFGFENGTGIGVELYTDPDTGAHTINIVTGDVN